MKMNRLNLIVPLLLAGANLCAKPPHADLVAENLFPPELIMQNAEAIDLTDEQKEKLKSEMHQAQDRFAEMQSKLQKQVEATAALLKKAEVDEPAALAQFEKVLDQERELRRAYLTLVLALKSKLTPEQQAKLQEIKKQHAGAPDRVDRKPQAPPASLQEKMKQLKAGVKKLEDDGGDVTSVGELMQEFKPLMDEQKFKDAETLVDQALKLLRDYKR